MAGPRQSLCPSCALRPRRGPGRKCLPCSSDEQHARRAVNRAGRIRPVPKFHPNIVGNKWLITCAQNATPVHEGALATMRVWCKANNAQLLVVPVRYHNPTSLWSAAQDTDNWWDDKISKNLISVRTSLGRNLVLAADVRTQPTAAGPLSGFEGLTGPESCIIAHPKVAWRTVASPTGRLPKILVTTGAITLPNATDTRAGKLAEFHHVLGGLIVERRGKRFFVRHICCDSADSSFVDIDKLYTPHGVKSAGRALALVLGDWHTGAVDEGVRRATQEMLDVFDPKEVIIHDLADGAQYSPHTINDPFAKAALWRDPVDAEGSVMRAFAEVREFVRDGRQPVVVASNHNDFLRRWLISHDWKSDPRTAEFYLRLAIECVVSARHTARGVEYNDPFSTAGRMEVPEALWLEPGESHVIAGIELGMHGHQGPNGSRGTLKNLSLLGAKAITGHTHIPGIEGGHIQVGTSSLLKRDYNTGPSAWMHAHCVIYASGKRALLPIIDGYWRGV